MATRRSQLIKLDRPPSHILGGICWNFVGTLMSLLLKNTADEIRSTILQETEKNIDHDY